MEGLRKGWPMPGLLVLGDLGEGSHGQAPPRAPESVPPALGIEQNFNSRL